MAGLLKRSKICFTRLFCPAGFSEPNWSGVRPRSRPGGAEAAPVELGVELAHPSHATGGLRVNCEGLCRGEAVVIGPRFVAVDDGHEGGRSGHSGRVRSREFQKKK